MLIKKVMNVKKVAFLTTIVLAGSLAACSPSMPKETGTSGTAAPATTANNATPAQATEAVEITMAWWGGEVRNIKFNDILDTYEKINPNVTFVRQYAPWGDYWTKLLTQAASNSLPDTFGMTAPYKNEFDARGAMIPLQPFVDSGKLDVSNFNQGSIDAGSIDGQLKFVTFGDTVNVLMFNKTMIEEAGMALPKGSMTYSEYIQYCKELSSKLPEGVYATTYERNFEIHVLQHGMNLVADNGKEPGYTKEVLKSYYEYLKALFDEKCGPTAELIAENAGKTFNDALQGQGKVAFFPQNVNQLKTYQAQTESELSAVRGVVADDATHKSVEPVQPSGYAISPNCKVKDEVAEFLNYFVNDKDNQLYWYMDLGAPGSKVIQKEIVDVLGDTPVDNVIKIELDLIQNILSGVEPYPGRLEGAAPLEDDVATKWTEIMFGRLTIDQAVDAHFDNSATMLR